MKDYFLRKHKLNYITECNPVMTKLQCFHCNYLYITVIISKCAKWIIHNTRSSPKL